MARAATMPPRRARPRARARYGALDGAWQTLERLGACLAERPPLAS